MLLFTRLLIEANPVTHSAPPVSPAELTRRGRAYQCIAGCLLAALVAFLATLGWATHSTNPPSEHTAPDQVAAGHSSDVTEFDSITPPR